MRTAFAAAGRAFLLAGFSALIVYAIGVLAAPQLGSLLLVAVAALSAFFAAAFAALAPYVPFLTLAPLVQRFIPGPRGEAIGLALDGFIHAFLGSLCVTLPGALGAPDLSTERSLVVAALNGALMAGLTTLEGLATPGKAPAPRVGVPYRSAMPPATPPV